MDNKQFEVMVKAYSSDLYRFAFWLCRDRWLAQDLVQDCFASAWKACGSVRDQRAIKAWLFSILRNAHASLYQRKRLHIEDADLEELNVPAEALGHERVELEECLAALPENYREPLMLQVLGGFSGKEISQMMGISEQNVMTRLCRARQSLRRLVHTGSNSDLEGLKKWNA
jgi:RNA polymerase sigma-70 factor (ECF subfamily)